MHSHVNYEVKERQRKYPLQLTEYNRDLIFQFFETAYFNDLRTQFPEEPANKSRPSTCTLAKNCAWPMGLETLQSLRCTRRDIFNEYPSRILMFFKTLQIWSFSIANIVKYILSKYNFLPCISFGWRSYIRHIFFRSRRALMVPFVFPSMFNNIPRML